MECRRRSASVGSLIVVLTMTVAMTAGVAAAGTTGTTRDQNAARPPVLVVGHRGASAKAPEHTGPSYDRAVWAGVDVLECDLQLTADRQLVCMHDPTVDRTTGGTATGPVDSFTLAQLRAMDFGSWFGPEFAGAKVVTLEEQISCYRAADPTLQFYIETKTQPDQGDTMETELVALLQRLDVVPEFAGPVRSSPVIIQSFDAGSLATVRRLAPELPTAYLVGAPTRELDAGQFPDVDVLAPSADVIAARPDLISAAHAAGLEVHTWTVDDPAEMTRLIDAGVDGFFTNDPATGRAVVDQAGLGSGREPLDIGDTPPTGPSAVPSCPVGMGLGLNPAPADIAAASDDGSAAQLEATDTSPTWPVIVGVGVLVAAGLVLAVRRLRRS